jgi:hypothetical protein
LSIVADEKLEDLVARRIREQLGEGGLQELIEAQQQIRATVRVEPRVEVSAVVIRPGEEVSAEVGNALSVIESTSPALAGDIKDRSPQDVNLAINLFMAIMQTLQFLLMLYQMVHQQPPTQPQVIEIFNQTTNVLNQTSNIVINMPPPAG